MPHEWPPYAITSIEVGEVISRIIDNPPECIDESRWPCVYFRLVAPSAGTLEVVLTYKTGTQGSQAVDVTVRKVGTSRYVWAQANARSGVEWHTDLTAPVTAGVSYDLTLWYTFPNLQYELRTRMR